MRRGTISLFGAVNRWIDLAKRLLASSRKSAWAFHTPAHIRSSRHGLNGSSLPGCLARGPYTGTPSVVDQILADGLPAIAGQPANGSNAEPLSFQFFDVVHVSPP
jgi:hypothetical protein